jgi:hypothetical protein
MYEAGMRTKRQLEADTADLDKLLEGGALKKKKALA